MILHNESFISFDEERKGKGRHFQSKFFEAGAVSYPEFGKTYLVKKETIDKFIDSMVGCPVIIKHKDISDANVKDEAVGYISNVWFNPEDSWYWCDGVIFDRDAEDLIVNENWSVSCGYEVTEKDTGGGMWHDIKFDEEILNGSFEHLAIVSNPRYREATILLNSSEERKMNLKKLFNAKKMINSEEKENMAKCKNEESTDKRKKIDEIEAMLYEVKEGKEKLTDELIRTIIGKVEKNSYEGSEDSRKDNESDEDEEEKKEDKKENSCKRRNDSKIEELEEEDEEIENESDEDEEYEEEYKEEFKKKNSKMHNSSFEDVRKLRNSIHDVKKQCNIESESVRFARGANY